MILKKGIIKRAFFTSVIVGSVLLIINHGDAIKIQEYLRYGRLVWLT